VVPDIAALGFAALALVLLFRWGLARFALSRAKHPSLRGHSKWSRRIARHITHFDYLGERFYASDRAPSEIAARRRQSIEILRRRFADASPNSLRLSQSLEKSISDVSFTSRYRVPIP
jgi:glutamate-1-semialdehyde 2,1-aminomutase